MMVGHSEHKVTVIAEITSDLGNQSAVSTYKAETIIVTIGNHARGDTGLNICIKGLMAPLKVRDKPDAIPIGMAMMVPSKNPRPTVNNEVTI